MSEHMPSSLAYRTMYASTPRALSSSQLMSAACSATQGHLRLRPAEPRRARVRQRLRRARPELLLRELPRQVDPRRLRRRQHERLRQHGARVLR